MESKDTRWEFFWRGGREKNRNNKQQQEKRMAW